MIERYTRPEMGAIWTEENRFKAWLEVEILACEAWSELGAIPKEDVKALRENATFDVNRIKEIEEETRHDVVAFTRAVSETLGEERKWVHYGLTSTDVVDTALSYLLKQANDILLADAAAVHPAKRVFGVYQLRRCAVEEFPLWRFLPAFVNKEHQQCQDDHGTEPWLL